MSRFDTDEQAGGAESSNPSVCVKDDAARGVAIRKDAKGNNATPSPLANLVLTMMGEVADFNKRQLESGASNPALCGFSDETIAMIHECFNEEKI